MDGNTELHQDERPGTPEPLPADARHQRQDDAARGDDEMWQGEDLPGERVADDGSEEDQGTAP